MILFSGEAEFYGLVEEQGDHLPGDDGRDPLPNFMLDAKAHDPNILPHMYDHEMLEEMFPLIEA